MKKALMYASVASMIQQFNMANIDLLIELGYKVDVACNFEFGSSITNEKIQQLKEALKIKGVSFYHIPIPRKLKDVENFRKSYKLTKQLMNKNRYNLIHCHSPIGGFLCRIANKNSKYYNNVKIIYTAHGFHFFKGNNMIKNFVFKSVEKYAARYTDVLITINKEDFKAAKKFQLKGRGTVEFVPGVGIDVDKIYESQGDRKLIVKELNIPVKSMILLSVGELIKRKNHEIIIKVLAKLPQNVHYIICGKGELEIELIKIIEELGLKKRVHLLGFRSDIYRIMKSSDIFVFPSLQEGLPVALMEALACGMPCIASNIRGNEDLIIDGKNGYLIATNDIQSWVNRLNIIMNENNEFCIDSEVYSLARVRERMYKIYEGKKICQK